MLLGVYRSTHTRHCLFSHFTNIFFLRTYPIVVLNVVVTNQSVMLSKTAKKAKEESEGNRVLLNEFFKILKIKVVKNVK